MAGSGDETKRNRVPISIWTFTAILVLFCLWPILVPPFGKPRQISFRTFPEVPDGENAARGYLRALRAMPPLEDRLYGQLYSVEWILPGCLARRHPRISRELTDCLDRCAPALQALHEAAERPGCQFFASVSESEQAPDWLVVPSRGEPDERAIKSFFALEALVQAAALQAIRLEGTGKPGQASQLYLDVARLGLDMTKPVAPSWDHRIYGRKYQTIGIMGANFSISDPRITARELRQLISRLVSLDNQDVLPSDILEEERDNVLRNIGAAYWGPPPQPDENGAINKAETIPAPVRALPGLRRSSYNYAVDVTMALYGEAKPFADAWEFSKLAQLQEKYHYGFPWSLNQFVVHDIVASTLLGGSLAGFFEAVADRRATLSLACIRLYRLERGKYPMTLDDAARNAGLPGAPLDPGSGKPMGYVLRKNIPVVWSVGSNRRGEEEKIPRPSDPIPPRLKAAFIYPLGGVPAHWTRFPGDGGETLNAL